MPTKPLPLQLYSGLSAAVGPLIYPRIARKLKAQGMAPERVEERKGYATEPRPRGKLLWCHAASVGETLSVLRLIEHLGQVHADLNVLLTSGTATSAQIVANRLPPRTRHQFAPMDTPRVVDRFLHHWAPDAGIFVESELWPNMLGRAQAAGIPLALVNARISDRSARKWARAAGTARHLLRNFNLIHCQDDRTADHLQGLGLDAVAKGANLKAMAAPLPVDETQATRLGSLMKDRPVWLAASTHPGEDKIMLDAHKFLSEAHRDALLVLVPRHPERAGDIANLIENNGLKFQQRSRGQDPTAKTQVYLADTLGETGLWYALCPITCLCGSFTPVGGHNPFEPAQGRSAILHGPLYANFAETYATFDANGAARQVADAKALGRALTDLISDPAEQTAMTTLAKAQVNAQKEGLAQIAQDLSTALNLG
ncbi:MAG: 3-deoxy-D-manno-octulosonic acid transferase [Pseudomonadota bacterium]